MTAPNIGSRDEWVEARTKLLDREKQLNRLRDELAEQRRQVHLAHRDVSFVCLSRAPYPDLAAYQARMGWTFPWYSSAPSDFNADFGVSFTPEQQEHGGDYNFTHLDHPPDEAPGLSAFAINEQGRVFHTYSTYSRGLDPLNTAYQLLDLTPHGRDEDNLAGPWNGSDVTTPTTTESTNEQPHSSQDM